jgi:hypothetical protein
MIEMYRTECSWVASISTKAANIGTIVHLFYLADFYSYVGKITYNIFGRLVSGTIWKRGDYIFEGLVECERIIEWIIEEAAVPFSTLLQCLDR